MLCDNLTMLFLGLLFIGISVIRVDAICQTCPQGWTQHGRSCYEVPPPSGNRLTWVESLEMCRNLGSELTVPNSQGENSFIWDIRQSGIDDRGDKHTWLGCLKVEGEGWLCEGEDRWQAQAVTNTSTICSVHDANFSIKWTEESCTKRKHILCERRLEKCIPSLRCTTAITSTDGHLARPGCLLGYAYKQLPVPHPLTCCIACYKDPDCHSFNMFGETCQLNNVALSQVDAGNFFIESDDCMYYDF